MINTHRGEVALQVGGQTYTLCLTLQALAEIETALEAEDLQDVATRLAKPKSGDLIAILGALMRGGGHDIADAAVGRLPLTLEDVIHGLGQAFATSGLLRGAKQPQATAPTPPDAPAGEAAKNLPAPQA